MTMRSSTFAIVVLLCALALPRSATAIEVGLELQPSVGVPLGSFPYGVPLTLDDAAGEAFLRIPNSVYNVLLNLRPTAGFQFGATLLLNNFTIRTAISVHRFSSASSTRYSVVRAGGQDMPALVGNLYLGQWDSGKIDISSESPTLVLAKWAVGYRWYLLEHKLRPYIPIGFGGSLLAVSGEANFGLWFYTGLGVEYRVAKKLDVGVALLYDWSGIFLPENFQADAAKREIAKAASSGNSVLEAFLQSLHTLQLAATVTYRF